MRVLHMVSTLVDSSGLSHVVANLSRQLVRGGQESVIYHLTAPNREVLDPGDPAVQVRHFPVVGGRTWCYSPELAAAMRDEVARFDVVHVHSLWLHMNVVAWRACRKSGIPFIVAPHGALESWCIHYHGWRKGIYGALIERRILNAAAAIHAVTGAEVDDIRSYAVTAPTVVVSNGYDPTQVEPLPDRAAARHELGLQPGELAVLYLSRLHPKKGLERLLEAAAAVPEAIPLRVLVGGSDHGSGYATRLKAMAHDLGVEARVDFRGELRGQIKKVALAAADIFTLPSSSEGHPLAVLEAMAAGLPVVVTPACNVPEVQTSGAGLIVPPDRTELAGAICRYARDEALRADAGAHARQLAVTRYTWERAGRDMARVYANVKAGNAPGEGLESGQA